MSTISITFEGETLLDVAQQADAFAALVVGAEINKNRSLTNVPPTGERKTRGRGTSKASVTSPSETDPPETRTVADVAATMPGKTIVEPDAEDRGEGPAPDRRQPEPDMKALEKAKEEALDILRKVYGKGDAGQKEVRALLKLYSVKKAGDVPVEKAEELLGKAQAALKKVEAEDAPI
jgi:hypothetical protein